MLPEMLGSALLSCSVSSRLHRPAQSLVERLGLLAKHSLAERLSDSMARLEAWVLRRAPEKHAGRRIVTARSLGITRECLYK